MNGRKANDLKNALEDLTTIHKALGDEAISAKNYIAAVGQYTYALEYLIYNANSAISHPQLLLSRSEAYLNLQRFTHARCDIYTVIVNNPTTATLRDCYDVLRELYLVENKSSEVADEKLALHLKMTLPDLFKCFVETGIAHDVEVPKMEGFLKRHYNSFFNPSEGKRISQLSSGIETELVDSFSEIVKRTCFPPLAKQKRLG